MSKPNDEAVGFFSRWSRRKTQVHQGGEPPPAVPAAQGALDATGAPSATGVPAAPGARDVRKAPALADEARAASLASSASSASLASPALATPQTGPAEAAPAPKPTLQDVEQLDAKSDYRSFVARDVDPEVRNAAFKKLFHSDPHFNVMDGLDVYIDDYNTPNPLPVAIMKTLVQARAMGLIDDELKEQDPPRTAEASEPGEAVGEGAGPADGEGTAEPADDAAGAGTGEPGADAISAEGSVADASAESPAQPVLVELKLVPDQASNDEPLSAAPSAASTAAGSVVPFPRRPGSANPA